MPNLRYVSTSFENILKIYCVSACVYHSQMRYKLAESITTFMQNMEYKNEMQLWK